MTNNNDNTIIRTEYDRILAGLDGLPDVTHTAPSTIRHVSFIGTSQTFVVSTYRQKDRGDTVFLETTGESGMKLMIPPPVVDAIVRQRDALTRKVRRKNGRASAAARKAAGIEPAFLKAKRKKGGR